MHPLIELSCLLVLLSFGYAAAKGGSRPLHDSVIGFLWWAGIMAALAVLMAFSDGLVWCIRIGMVAAALYVIRIVVRWGYHLWIHMPAIQDVTRHHVLQACEEFAPDRRDAAKEAATLAMKGYPTRLVLAAVVEAWRRDVPADKIMGVVAEECDRATTSLQWLTVTFREGRGRETRLDRPFLEELILLYGREPVEAVLKGLEKEPGGRTARQLLHSVSARAADRERHDLLRALGLDAPGVAGEAPLAPVRDILFWMIALIHPFWVYLYFRGSQPEARAWFLISGFCGYALCMWAYLRAGEVKRSLVFAITTALIGGYGFYLRFVANQSAGWVFTAVFGLLYITALLNVGAVFDRQAERRAHADIRGA